MRTEEKMTKPKCSEYKPECHQKLGVVYCRDVEHKGSVECPVIDKTED